MDEQNCQGCDQKNKCEEVYKNMSDSQAPPVTLKVVTALLLPILVFIGSLIGFELVLEKTIPAFLLAVLITLILVFALRKDK